MSNILDTTCLTQHCYLTSSCLFSSRPAPAIQEEILYTSVKVTRSADSVELDILRQCEDDPSIHLYAQVKPARLRRAQTTSSSLLPKELQHSKHRQTNRDQVIDQQVDTSQDSHAVTYAQLHIMTPRQGRQTSSFQEENADLRSFSREI